MAVGDPHRIWRRVNGKIEPVRVGMRQSAGSDDLGRIGRGGVPLSAFVSGSQECLRDDRQGGIRLHPRMLIPLPKAVVGHVVARTLPPARRRAANHRFPAAMRVEVPQGDSEAALEPGIECPHYAAMQDGLGNVDCAFGAKSVRQIDECDRLPAGPCGVAAFRTPCFIAIAW